MQVHIPLLIICVLLCLLSFKPDKRKKWILPICFLLITVYMAIRYDYGLDFWSYYRGFQGTERRTESTEPLYWFFNSLFPKYYLLIATISVLLMATVFVIVKKYVIPKYYALFFLCFMCIPGQSFTMMTALRSDLAFVVLAYGLCRYYIEEKKIGMYLLFVVIASLFHNSVMVFAFVPLLEKLILKANPSVIFGLFIVFSVFSFTGITQRIGLFLFGLLDKSQFLSHEYYNVYATKYISNANGAIGRLPFIFPAYYICAHARTEKEGLFPRFYVLAVIYFSIFFLAMDYEYRYTMYMFIFALIAMIMSLEKHNSLNKTIAILPVIVYCIFQLYGYYMLMRRTVDGAYSEGNFFIYETIFQNKPFI